MDDVLNQGGADSFVIGADNLPNHTHDINLSTSTFDHGTKTTSTNGSHSHKTTLNREATQRGVNVTYGDESTEGADQIESSSAGEHTHSVSIDNTITWFQELQFQAQPHFRIPQSILKRIR